MGALYKIVVFHMWDYDLYFQYCEHLRFKVFIKILFLCISNFCQNFLKSHKKYQPYINMSGATEKTETQNLKNFFHCKPPESFEGLKSSLLQSKTLFLSHFAPHQSIMPQSFSNSHKTRQVFKSAMKKTFLVLGFTFFE